jgi:fluoroacetyl-CoA thioesterase
MVDLTPVTAGLTGTSRLLVGPEHTAAFVGSGRLPVLATPVMINVIEVLRSTRPNTFFPPAIKALAFIST